MSLAGRLYHYVTGEGPPLLILNGVYQAADSWKSLVKALQGHFTVIGVDLPNQGKSPTDAGLASLPRYADVVTDFITLKKLQPAELACFGFSFGADILLDLQANRGLGLGCAIAASATPTAVDRYVNQYVDAQLAALCAHGVEAMMSIVLQKIFSPYFCQKYPGYASLLMRHLKELFGHRPAALAALVEATRPWRTRAPDWSTRPRPFELLIGREDLLYPAYLFEDYGPGLGIAPTLVTGGHAFPMEQTAETAALIRAAWHRAQRAEADAVPAA